MIKEHTLLSSFHFEIESGSAIISRNAIVSCSYSTAQYVIVHLDAEAYINGDTSLGYKMLNNGNTSIETEARSLLEQISKDAGFNNVTLNLLETSFDLEFRKSGELLEVIHIRYKPNGNFDAVRPFRREVVENISKTQVNDYIKKSRTVVHNQAANNS